MKNSKDYSIYILECNDKSFYTGMTTDLFHRFDQHKNGEGSQYTKSRFPVKIVFAYKGIKEYNIARAGEKYIKSLTRKRKIKLIEKDPKAIRLF